jgi:hypothetical protein
LPAAPELGGNGVHAARRGESPRQALQELPAFPGIWKPEGDSEQERFTAEDEDRAVVVATPTTPGSVEAHVAATKPPLEE